MHTAPLDHGTTRRPAPRSTSSRHGLTLLELLLALALSVLVLAAIGMSIDLNLRVLDSRRSYVEEAQLARALLRTIADDIRNVVPKYEQDVSAAEALMSSPQNLADAANALTGGSGGSGSPSGGGSSGGGSSNAGGGGPSGGGPSGGGSSGGNGSQGSSGGGSGSGGARGSSGSGGGGSSGGGGGSGSSGSGGSSSGGSPGGGYGTGTGTDGSGMSDPSANTQDLANNTTPPPTPGIYGNQYELQVDVSRLPRMEEYLSTLSTADATGSIQPVSEVKTVAYYLGTAADNLQALSDGTASAAGGTGGYDSYRSGLVRREIDRAVGQWASLNGGVQTIDNQARVVAPEVVGLEFRYFDGASWYTEWDSSSAGLPVAVEILLTLSSNQASGATATGAGSTTGGAAPLGTSASTTDLQNLSMYRTVVRLPTAKPNLSTDSTGSTGMESTGTGGTGTGTTP